jgi:acetylornithine/N-succinyldiaminopimelate aminotransferase
MTIPGDNLALYNLQGRPDIRRSFPSNQPPETVMTALMNTYNRVDLAFERGEGAFLITADGRRYLDFASGIAVTALGHCHPHLVKTLQEQATKLWHTSNLFRIPEGERLAQRLVDATFADAVFFGNSGAEALECGFKLIRKYQDDFGDPARYRVIGFEGAFHGRTLATLAAAGNEKYLKGYAPTVDGFDQVAFGNLNEVRAKIGPETAAILIEPVQGEGGMRAADAQFLKDLRTVCDEYGLLLMFDEVQCGMGRTGRLFAHEWAGVTPDIMTSAKAIGGGYPLGACLATAKVAAAFGHGSHGSTFGGNPLASAAALAVLDVLEQDQLLDKVQERGRQLAEQLSLLQRKYPTLVATSRGRGLLQALVLKDGVDARALLGKLQDGGVLLTIAGGQALRFTPPLTITPAELGSALEVVDRVLGTCS